MSRPVESGIDELALGHRGPEEHALRQRIVDAAHQHFAHFGFAKTNVTDLAAAIGMSKAYIYKFFDSKHAIGQAICQRMFDRLLSDAEIAIESEKEEAGRLEALFLSVVSGSANLFFKEKRLFEVLALSSSEDWPVAARYCSTLREMIADLIAHGRDVGAFERTTPLDETVSAVCEVMETYFDPLMLQFHLDDLGDAPAKIIRLIRRSLRP